VPPAIHHKMLICGCAKFAVQDRAIVQFQACASFSSTLPLRQPGRFIFALKVNGIDSRKGKPKWFGEVRRPPANFSSGRDRHDAPLHHVAATQLQRSRLAAPDVRGS
jgi:hypothetical protein